MSLGWLKISLSPEYTVSETQAHDPPVSRQPAVAFPQDRQVPATVQALGSHPVAAGKDPVQHNTPPPAPSDPWLHSQVSLVFKQMWNIPMEFYVSVDHASALHRLTLHTISGRSCCRHSDELGIK